MPNTWTLVNPTVTGNNLSIDSSVLPFTVDADVSATSLQILIYNQILTFSHFTVVNSLHRFTGSIAIQPLNEPTLVQIRDASGNNKISFNLIFTDSQLVLSIAPPSGLRNYKGQSFSKVEWITPSFVGFIGVRLLLSTDESGVSAPYIQFGDLVTTIERSANAIVTSNSSTQVQGNTTTITAVEQTQTVNFSSINVAAADVSNVDEFFAMVSTVIQDSVSNVVFESRFNGPVKCGFVNLKKVSPADFLALQRREDIAARMIAGITRLYPDLDLTPRSELRDILIDPVALELANMSVRELFARMSQSISAVSQLDDLNGDGLSDSLNENPMKQQISRAYGLSATDTQTLIDKQFDILGEQAGISRSGSIASVVELTFYTFTQPVIRVTIPEGATVATIPDTETPALNFITRGSAIIDPTNVNSFFNSERGWWAVTIPAQCAQTGSVGNVGAGAIRQIIANIPSAFNVQNLTPADFGTDQESNQKFAERIQDRLVTGVDSGTRNGYLAVARGTPGVVDARVVAAGNLEMLRDWDPLRQKHVFGAVDIYTRGFNFSDQTENVVFSYQNTSNHGDFANYFTATLLDRGLLKLQISNFDSAKLPFFTIVEIRVQRGSNSFYLGTKLAQNDNLRGVITLDPNEQPFILVGDAISVAPAPLLINNVVATNAVIIQALAGAQASTYQFQVFARYQSGISHSPALQPVVASTSVTGQTGLTGAIDPARIRLIHSTDFLLEGGSTKAKDLIAVDSDVSSLQTKNLTFVTSGPTMLSIDRGMDVPLDGNGKPLNIISVRSEDLSTLYQFGADYTIVPTDRYHSYGIKLTSNSTIQLDQPVIVAYNKFSLVENLTLVPNENVTLRGTIPTQLAQFGFVHNVWQPESYGNKSLSYDGAAFANDGSVDLVNSTGLCGALIPHEQRYIKVTQNNGIVDVVMHEGTDFILTVNPVSGAAALARILTGRIFDGATLKVSYFVNEEFQIISQFPAFVEQLTSILADTKHAAADVLVKSMVANPIDITLTVELDSNATPEVIDLQIRSVLGITLDNAKTKLTQAEIIRMVKSITGVSNVFVPLEKFAKSDGAYNVGIIIPSQTKWVPVSSVSQFQGHVWSSSCFITQFSVLPDSTIPSGGLRDSFVGILHEGEAYVRSNSVLDFQSKSAGSAFYIIGVNDQVDANTLLDSTFVGRVMISVPINVSNPGVFSWRVTYQVFAEGGSKDIVISSTEYLKPGRITIDYITG